MPITGVAVQTVPDEMQKVYKTLEKMEGVTLYGDDNKGNIIAVLDTKNKKELDELSQKIERVDGVVQVMGVYNYFEDDVTEAEENAP